MTTNADAIARLRAEWPWTGRSRAVSNALLDVAEAARRVYALEHDENSGVVERFLADKALAAALAKLEETR